MLENGLQILSCPSIFTIYFSSIHSQKILEALSDGSVIIQLRVHMTFEFDRLILAFGEAIEVISPPPDIKKSD